MTLIRKIPPLNRTLFEPTHGAAARNDYVHALIYRLRKELREGREELYRARTLTEIEEGPDDDEDDTAIEESIRQERNELFRIIDHISDPVQFPMDEGVFVMALTDYIFEDHIRNHSVDADEYARTYSIIEPTLDTHDMRGRTMTDRITEEVVDMEIYAAIFYIVDRMIEEVNRAIEWENPAILSGFGIRTSTRQ